MIPGFSGGKTSPKLPFLQIHIGRRGPVWVCTEDLSSLGWGRYPAPEGWAAENVWCPALPVHTAILGYRSYWTIGRGEARRAVSDWQVGARSTAHLLLGIVGVATLGPPGQDAQYVQDVDVPIVVAVAGATGLATQRLRQALGDYTRECEGRIMDGEAIPIAVLAAAAEQASGAAGTWWDRYPVPHYSGHVLRSPLTPDWQQGGALLTRWLGTRE